MTHSEARPTARPEPIDAPRAIDHAVLPVRDLETARERLAALGFTVAPDARHPFGTENCCVYLADGAYLEPLAIGQRETCEAAAIAGNVFVARDQAWRFRNGEDGFSAVAFATDDADADHRAFREGGVSAGRMLAFSRPLRTATGEVEEARFRLAFAGDLRGPDSFFFTCQRINAPAAGRGALERHANGVTGIDAIVAVEQNPSDFQYLLQDVMRQREVRAHSFGMDIEAGRSRISVYNPAGLRAWFGVEEAPEQRGLAMRAIVFNVTHLADTRKLLDRNGIAYREHSPARLLVDPAPGQGAIFAFEERE